MTALFAFDNSFARQMEGFYVPLEAEPAADPQLLLLNEPLAVTLGINPEGLRTDDGIAALAGNVKPVGSAPLAQAYAGHQFGGFSPSLGDGRALLLGEVVNPEGERFDIQLKGSGRTPFSRNGDGKAALGPVLREYLMSEAMHALGVPTTRSLAAVTTGDEVFRERPLPGAVLTRVASSHIRVGTFQFFAARGLTDRVRQLADYAIARHDPDLIEKDEKYLEFFDRVIDRQTRLIAKWMSVGFIHGVMNTDNMTISGETIDYGPCAFMDIFDPDTVFSSIDDFGRYAYKNQPVIAQWNLVRLAEAMLDLFHENREKAVGIATGRIETVPQRYEKHWMALMRDKLGFANEKPDDTLLIDEFHVLMKDSNADFTRAFRSLADVQNGKPERFFAEFANDEKAADWLERWKNRISDEDRPSGVVAEMMNKTNPLYIPRNHQVEHALHEAVTHGNMEPFHNLYDLLQNPFEAQENRENYESGAPENSPPHITYCGT